MIRGALAATVVFAPLVAACQLLFPTVAEPAGVDAGDARADGLDAGSQGVDVALEVGPYNDPDSSNWQIYSLSLVSPYFQGGTFDGRYVYFSPGGGRVTRHDTRAAFGAGWSAFDPAKVDGGGDLFSGAAFDGRFVYFVGFRFIDQTFHAIFARYDSKAPLADPTSWREIDLTAVDPRAVAFAGAAFDGRFLYFAPIYNGFVERLDTHGSFEDPASWVGWDLGTTGAPGFEGAIFDGHHVYFVPHYHGVLGDAGWTEGPPSSLAARLDPAKYGSSGAWTLFDTTKLDKNATGFAAGAFDGRYVYFVPYDNYDAIAVRYDTQKPAFDVEGSWEKFDCTLALPSATGFVGGAFDGRYVYFVPYKDSAGSSAGVFLRYDTTADFRAARSWSTYDIANENANAIGFVGAVFDGEYLTFIPNTSGVAAQFHARTTPLTPSLPLFPGSFF